MTFDTNIPLPNRTQNRDKYDVKGWPVNGSKFWAGRDVKMRAAIISCAKAANKGATFSSRSVTENGADGFRFWRTA